MTKRRGKTTRNFALCEELESRHLMSAGLAAHITPAGHLRLPSSLIGTHSSTGILPIRRDPSTPAPPGTPTSASKFRDINVSVGETFTGYLGTIALTAPLGTGPVTSPITAIDYDSTGTPTGMASVFEYKIFWADGTNSQATLVQKSLGVYDLYGTHTYHAAGIYQTLVNPSIYLIQDPAYHGPPIAIPDHALWLSLVQTAVITVGVTAPR